MHRKVKIIKEKLKVMSQCRLNGKKQRVMLGCVYRLDQRNQDDTQPAKLADASLLNSGIGIGSVILIVLTLKVIVYRVFLKTVKL